MGQAKDDVAKTDGGSTPIVLRFDMHCEGCAKKVKRFVKKLQGVESVNSDVATNKLMVFGKADPDTVRDKLAAKIRKKVDLISSPPPPKKSDAKDGGGGGDKKVESKDGGDKNTTSKDVRGGGGGVHTNSNDKSDKKTDEKSDKKTNKNIDEKSDKKLNDKSIKQTDDNKEGDKNTKEVSLSTVVLSMRLHCERCIQKIEKFINAYKGVETMNINAEQKTVTVKGKMDVKAMVPDLNIKFKRLVTIVPSKKDDGPVVIVIPEKITDKTEKVIHKTEKDGEKKNVSETNPGGGEKINMTVEKKSPPVIAAVSRGGDGGAKVEVNKMEYHGYQQHQGSYYYGGPGHVYGHAYMMEAGSSQSQYYEPQSYVTEQYNVPSYGGYAAEMFSDENPNGCFVM